MQHLSKECNNHIFLQTYGQLRQGRRCPICGLKNGIKKSKETLLEKNFSKFQKEISELTNDEYSLIGIEDVSNRKQNFKFRHNSKDCNNHEFIRNMTDFRRGRRCPVCSKKIQYALKRKTTEAFKEEILNLVGEEFSLLSEYGKNNSDKVLIQHNICNTKFWIRASNFRNRCSCPACNESRGENLVRRFLESNKISFESQKTFDDLKDKDLLRFDFFIESLNILIEYDGIQHFEPINFSGREDFDGEKELALIQYHDSLKNQYAEKNNIKLIRIKYTDILKIDSILRENLKI